MTLNPLAPGNFPPNPLEKPGYTLTFSDEFEQVALDESKWIACYLPQWSSREHAKANYTFNGSSIVLQITREQQAWCPEWDGANRASVLQSGVYAGAAGSKIGQSRFSDELVVREAQDNAQKFAQQYGYFETRVKGSAASGVHVSLWMIGYEDVPEHSGEICLYELLGRDAGVAESSVRYGIHPWSDPTLREEFFDERFPVDTTQFHIYAVEWTPTQVDFLIDNVLIRTVQQSPAYPMQFMLGMFELPTEGGWNGPYDPDAPYPKTFTVDYVRAYQPVSGYTNK